MRASIDASELRAYSRDLAKLARDWRDIDVEVYCQPTAGRSGAENAEIYMVQAEEDRDPLFLSQSENARAVDALEDGAADAVEDAKLAPILQSAKRLGQLFVGWIRDHIKSGRSEQGRMRPVSFRWAKYKGKKPVLIDTGQLYSSLDSRVKRG